jgi:uncharacterized protein
MDVMEAARAAAFWTALHLILILVLSVLVVRQRQKHHVVIGDGGIPSLIQAIRAFGNAVEYIPTGLIAIAVLAFAGAAALQVHAIGVMLLISRIAHAIGLSRSTDASVFRTVGVLATWITYIAASVSLIFYAIP